MTECFVCQSDVTLSSAATIHTYIHIQTHLVDNCKPCFPTLLLRPIQCVRLCVNVCVVNRQAQHVLRCKFPKHNTRSSTGRRAALLILTDYPSSLLSPFTSLSLTHIHTLTFSHSLSVVLASCWLVTKSRAFSLLSHTPRS